ncbi:slipin family protein, partial [Streptomyces sp. NPDC058864]
ELLRFLERAHPAPHPAVEHQPVTAPPQGPAPRAAAHPPESGVPLEEPAGELPADLRETLSADPLLDTVRPQRPSDVS